MIKLRLHIQLKTCFYLLIFYLGHTLHEIFILREGRFKRIPDFVVWPGIVLYINCYRHYGVIRIVLLSVLFIAIAVFAMCKNEFM
jgi:hypothetical protein